jgi:peptide-methionine (R)-S-oxide reductase
MRTYSSLLTTVKHSVRPGIVRAPIAKPTALLFMGSYFSTQQPAMSSYPVQRTDAEWRAVLSPEQFRILRQKGTERPGTGEYNKHNQQGVYTCAGCDAPLYKSTTKFDSGCGWPAFFEGVPGAIERHEDRTLGMTRIEIVCKNCGGHLG